jgi:hypothetical protein
MLRPISFQCVRWFQLDSIVYAVRLLFHERFVAALEGTHWFKWTYFHERVLLFPQRCCCQGHGDANTASREDQRNPATGSGGFVLRCWVETVVGGGDGSSAVENEANRLHPWTIPAPNC